MSHSASPVGTFCDPSEAQDWSRGSGCLCSGPESPLAKSQALPPQLRGLKVSESPTGNFLDSGPIQSALSP